MLDVVAEPPAQSSPSATSSFDEPREIQVHIVISRVFDIDTITQTFKAEVKIFMTWACPDGENPPSAEEDDGDWEPEWSPKFRFSQLIDEIKSEATYSVRFVEDDPWVCMESLHLLTIQEALELEYFPIDCQDLSIEIVSKLPSSHSLFVPLEGGPWVKLLDGKCVLNDFDLLKELPITCAIHQIPFEDISYSACVVKINVERQSNYYGINVLMMNGLICSFSLFSFSLHPADIEGRLGIDFDLLLTAVAFRFVQVSMLPSLSYITTLDEYSLGGFFFLTCVTAVHAAIPHFYIGYKDFSPLTFPPLTYDDEEDLIATDRLCFLAILSFWCLFNLVYTINFVWRQRREYRKLLHRAMEEQMLGNNSKKVLMSAESSIQVMTSDGKIQVHEKRGTQANTREC